MQILNGRRHRVEEIAFSHDGRWLAAGRRGGLHIWDTSNPTLRPQQPPIPGVYRRAEDLAFRLDGRLFFRANWNLLALHDVSKPEQAPVPLGRFQAEFVLSPDGARVIRVAHSSPLRSWVFSPHDRLVEESSIRDSGFFYYCAAFSPDGDTIATIKLKPTRLAEKPLLTLRATKTLEPIREVSAGYRDPAQLLFSPDGTKIILRSAASLACWNVAELDRPPRKAMNPSRKHFLSMALHPDGQLLTVDNDAIVRVWDVNTLSVTRAIEWRIGKLYAVAVSPDGFRAAVGSSTGKILVWDWD